MRPGGIFKSRVKELTPGKKNQPSAIVEIVAPNSLPQGEYKNKAHDFSAVIGKLSGTIPVDGQKFEDKTTAELGGDGMVALSDLFPDEQFPEGGFTDMVAMWCLSDAELCRNLEYFFWRDLCYWYLHTARLLLSVCMQHVWADVGGDQHIRSHRWMPGS